MIVLDQRDVVGLLCLDEVAGVLVLGVQGIEGDGAAGRVEAGQQRLEGGDLAVLVGDWRWFKVSLPL
ncbi:MAG TPA: hypothetical protein VHH34_20310 [Pseudonocardiaceae bacterium]|nr:hypothetical protein [Pseudonocardiaceae bacterium]